MQVLLGEDLAAVSQDSSLARFPNLDELLTRLEFIADRGLLVVRHVYKAAAAPIDDPTGIECLINKWHIEDLVPPEFQNPRGLAVAGVAFARGLLRSAKAVGTNAIFRAIVSVQEKSVEIPIQTCSVRLHTLRPENPWLADDLEGYLDEGLLVMDE